MRSAERRPILSRPFPSSYLLRNSFDKSKVRLIHFATDDPEIVDLEITVFGEFDEGRSMIQVVNRSLVWVRIAQASCRPCRHYLLLKRLLAVLTRSMEVAAENMRL